MRYVRFGVRSSPAPAIAIGGPGEFGVFKFGIWNLEFGVGFTNSALRILHLALLITCLLSPVPCLKVEAAELKIGYVNLAKVFDGYERTKSSDAVLEKKGKQKEGELEGRMSELKKLRQSLELLNDQAKETKTHEIEEKTDELQRFRTNSAKELRRERDKVAGDILKEIQQTVEDYAKSNGFLIILDERSILYGQAANDVTDEVLKALNNRYTAAAKQKQ